ncbi:MAG: hypothetical protein E6R03_09185 [Hyphomicrobiaceae bacterium]|nr:MAG: hypothetical protein E6R03_09185 [Hyphomicrobiaceae bacterium]
MSQYPAATAPVCPLGLPGCSGRIRERGAKCCANCSRTRHRTTIASLSPEASVDADRAKLKTSSELLALRKKYDESLRLIDTLERRLDIAGAIDSTVDTFTIEPMVGSGTSEATPVIVASDWHLEERVGAEVGGLNFFNLAVFHERGQRFWKAAHRLVKLLNQDVNISTVVLALLGDFITGAIHGEENAEMNELQPIHAIIEAQNMIASGIEFLLANTPYNYVVVCHSGNHARTTKTTRFSAENGHSLEFLMYKHLAAYFREEPRITFIVPDAPHSYIRVYDQTIRFMHGHQIKFGGGVGGVYIPAAKKIAKWDQARHADLTVFGHFHQLLDGGNFLVNGSLIGYNAFAMAIGAAFDVPKQLLFMIDKKHGRTCTWPIYLSSKAAVDVG